ncbi:MAG: hypothetical protein LBQ20_12160 [Rhodanobacter sp.]|jgi:hypothetical protein|nr:hypothetical protein [Rhodanobacter sp.]
MPSPIPVLEIRRRNPAQRRRIVLLLAFAWLVSLAAVAVATAVWRERMHTPRPVDVEHTNTVQPVPTIRNADDLKARIVVLERSEQVAKAALADVQQTLKDRDEEIDSLRVDLAFYGRLVGSGKGEGLAVHALHVQPVKSSPHAWNFTATLTQNFQRGRDIKGRLTLSVEGIAGGKLKALDWNTLCQGQNASGIEYGFKYFQQVGGTIMLPVDFTPNQVVAHVDGDGGRVEQKFSWGDAVKGEENNDVRQ